jgi:hypothetical protein
MTAPGRNHQLTGFPLCEAGEKLVDQAAGFWGRPGAAPSGATISTHPDGHPARRGQAEVAVDPSGVELRAEGLGPACLPTGRLGRRGWGTRRPAWSAAVRQSHLGWQPSRFLTDRGEAERALQVAQRLGSINAAAAELGTTWPSLRKAFARHGLGMPARNPETVRQQAVKAARRRSGQPDTPGPDPHGGSCLDHIARWRNAKAARSWRGGVGRATAGEVGFELPD